MKKTARRAGYLLAVVGAMLSAGHGAASSEEGGASAPPPMRKYVSEKAHFVLYVPEGWKVEEGQAEASWWVSVHDPETGCRAATVHGQRPAGGEIRGLACAFLRDLGAHREDLDLVEARVSEDERRLYCRGRSEGSDGRTLAFRAWISTTGATFTCLLVEAPDDLYASKRQLLLSLLLNVGAMRGAFTEADGQPLPTASYRLPDGSATFALPIGWSVLHLGPAQFIAHDPGRRYAFLVANARAVSPRLGVCHPAIPVSCPLSPHEGLVFFARRQGLLPGVRMLDVVARPDIERQAAAHYTAGPVSAEDFTYAFDGEGYRGRGFSLGIVYGSHLDTGWSLTHFTAIAPEDDFERLAATFREMGESYRTTPAFIDQYVRDGMARLRWLTWETAALVRRNAEEIRCMMHAAYRERVASQDYIDYLRTRTIRGEADWVSQCEGGTVFRTDRWGVQNLVTGERWGRRPLHYVEFRGTGCGYGDLIEINTRELYERHLRFR